MLFGEKTLARSAKLDIIHPKDTAQLVVDYCVINDAVSNRSIDYLNEEDALFDTRQDSGDY